MDYGFAQNRKRIEYCRTQWEKIKSSLNIIGDTVVLVLANENECLDQMALNYLPDYVLRKRAVRAEILVPNDIMKAKLQNLQYNFAFKITLVDSELLRDIYEYFCFAFNLDNITFTFLDLCTYNTLGRIIEETDINEEEAACLGVYWLRELPGEIANV